EEQVGDLQIGRLLGQLLDRVSAVLEDALLAVDEGDRRPARRRGHERRVIGHEPEVVLVGLDLAQLGGADRPVLDGNLVLLAGPVVGHRQGTAGRRYAPVVRWLPSLGSHGAPVTGVPAPAPGMASELAASKSRFGTLVGLPGRLRLPPRRSPVTTDR